ncbi:MAG: DDE-type integrase/transposase/recombinase, partial [Hyphomicrobium sp.]
QARGYEGGYSRVKQFVRGLVPASPPEPVVRFETEPGRQMQADWATVGTGAAKLKVFIATLSWSRMAYVEFCDDEQVETLIACHERAFLAFGGVPRSILYDNLWTPPVQGQFPVTGGIGCVNLSGLLLERSCPWP